MQYFTMLANVVTDFPLMLAIKVVYQLFTSGHEHIHTKELQPFHL